jgi:hypothetical protein
MNRIAHFLLIAAALSAVTSLAACAPAGAADAKPPRLAEAMGTAMPAMQRHMAQMMRAMCEQPTPQADATPPAVPGNDAMQSMMRQHMAMMDEMCAAHAGAENPGHSDAMRDRMEQRMKQMQQMMGHR